MPKKKKRTVLSATKEEQYKQTILELKHELYEAQMDRDILKTLVTITARDMAKDQIK
jgi:transposase